MKRLHRVAIALVVSLVALTHAVDLHAQIVPGTELSSVQELFGITAEGEARSLYDPQTGEVFVAIGAGVVIFAIEGDNVRFEDVIFDDAFQAFATQADDAGIGVVNLDLTGIPAGVYGLGPVLDPDPSIVTAADFLREQPNITFRSGALGVPAVNSEINVLIAVPEPSSLFALVALCGAVVTVRRR